jgi:hypothetical protein
MAFFGEPQAAFRDSGERAAAPLARCGEAAAGGAGGAGVVIFVLCVIPVYETSSSNWR